MDHVPSSGLHHRLNMTSGSLAEDFFDLFGMVIYKDLDYRMEIFPLVQGVEGEPSPVQTLH